MTTEAVTIKNTSSGDQTSNNTAQEQTKDKYRFIGPMYDFLSAIYSGKSIHECKVGMLNAENIKPGDKVLVAGVGHGKDAIHAAELGAEVTVVDLSETMLNKFQEGLDKSGKTNLNIRKVHSDIFKFDEIESFDVVVANFFLNVFYEETMAKVLEHLVALTKKGGKVVVGDFAFPEGNVISRLFKKAYWYLAVSLFWMFTNNAMHSIYNYPDYMKKQGLIIRDRKYFKLLNVNCYWSVLGQKPA